MLNLIPVICVFAFLIGEAIPVGQPMGNKEVLLRAFGIFAGHVLLVGAGFAALVFLLAGLGAT